MYNYEENIRLKNSPYYSNFQLSEPLNSHISSDNRDCTVIIINNLRTYVVFYTAMFIDHCNI